MIICALLFQSATAQIEEFQDEWGEQSSTVWETFELDEKLNLNKASVDELLAFGFSLEQANCMADHKEKFGNWLHESELQQCHVELEFIRTHRYDWSAILEDSRFNYLMQNQKTPYIPSVSVTSSFNNSLGTLKNPTWHTKIESKWGKFARFVYNTQTDAGEKPFDFQTAAFELKSLKNLKKLVLGKYQWNWNHGLVFAAPYSIGRSFNLGSWVNNYRELRYAVSTNEDLGLWGLGSKWQFRKNEFYFSMGSDKIDTRLNETGTAFLKRHYGGLHLTDLEKSRQDNNQLNQLFGAWHRQFQNHSINLSSTVYTYSIPRIQTIVNIYKEHIHEFQYAVHRLMNGQILLNMATNSRGNWSYYSAGAWSLSSKFDLAFRIQSISDSFFTPERSPFTQGENGKRNLELGIDFKPSKNHLIQIRNVQIKQLGPLMYPKGISHLYHWTMQYINNINRHDYFQFRWKNMHSPIGNPVSQIFIQTKFNLSTTITTRTVFVQEHDLNAIENNTALLAQVGYKLGALNLQFYSIQFKSNSPLYLTLPSAQFPWKLGIFNGNGWSYGLVMRYRMHKNIRFLFSIDATKKNSLLDEQSQKPRIFVQLVIL